MLCYSFDVITSLNERNIRDIAVDTFHVDLNLRSKGFIKKEALYP